MFKNAQAALRLGMKDFPWDVNNFVKKVKNLSNANTITRDFMQYSSNDIFYTAITAIVLLNQDIIEPAKAQSKQKLDLYNNYYKTGTLSYPRNLRQAKYCAMNITTILQSTINNRVRTPTLLRRWSEINSTSRIMNHKNPKIQAVLNLTQEDKKLVNRRLETLETFLQSEERFFAIKKRAIFVKYPGQVSSDDDDGNTNDPFDDLL